MTSCRSSSSGSSADSANTLRYRAFAALAELIQTAIDAGQQVDLTDLRAEYPQFADELDEMAVAIGQLDGDSGTSIFTSSESPADENATHQRVLGDFRILREIGRGGMGVVYEAEQVSLGRCVALKVLPFASMLDERRRQRFRSEAMAAAALHHPHIVPVFAVGQEQDVPYYAMQLIDGHTIAEEIIDRRAASLGSSETSGRQSIELAMNLGEASTGGDASNTEDSRVDTRVLKDTWTTDEPARGQRFEDLARWAVDVADALQYAHDNGIIHRDVKPSNLLRDSRGKVWLADFGLARIETGSGLTVTGDMLGTLRYMSPEQAAGGPRIVDQRTDIYSLGVTLYEVLTLSPAVPGNNRAETMRFLTSYADPVAISLLAPDTPSDLQTIVMKALAKEPEDRYSSAEKLSRDLRRFLEHKPIIARRSNAIDHIAKWLRRHRSIAWGAAASLL